MSWRVFGFMNFAFAIILWVTGDNYQRTWLHLSFAIFAFAVADIISVIRLRPSDVNTPHKTNQGN